MAPVSGVSGVVGAGGWGREGGRRGVSAGMVRWLGVVRGSGDRGRWPERCAEGSCGLNLWFCQPVPAGIVPSFWNAVSNSSGPWPCVLEVQLAAAAGEREPGGDVQQSVAQPLWFALAIRRRPECLGPDDRSCASITISSHTSFIANCLNGSLARPVFLSSQMRSSTRAR